LVLIPVRGILHSVSAIVRRYAVPAVVHMTPAGANTGAGMRLLHCVPQAFRAVAPAAPHSAPVLVLPYHAFVGYAIWVPSLLPFIAWPSRMPFNLYRAALCYHVLPSAAAGAA